MSTFISAPARLRPRKLGAACVGPRARGGPAIRLLLACACAWGAHCAEGADAGPVPVPVVPAGVAPLPASEQRDAQGRSCLLAAAKEFAVQLPGNLIQLTTTPTGKYVFAIYRDEPTVSYLDPETLQPLAQVPTPQNPVAMWSDDARIVLACEESKVVTIIDTEHRKLIRSVRLKDRPDMWPVLILGKAPDGRFMTIWHRKGEPGWMNSLFQISESGQAELIVSGEFDRCMWVMGGSMLFCQTRFADSDHSGQPNVTLYAKGSESGPSDLLASCQPFPPGPGFKREFAQCFPGFDGACMILPGLDDPPEKKQVTTWLTTPDLRRLVASCPGAAIAEVPHDGMLVTWEMIESHKAPPQWRVNYASRATGRVFRMVTITTDHQPLYTTSATSRRSPVIYVPGHELLLRMDRFNLASAAKSDVLVSRCGPVVDPDRAHADLASDQPPRAGKVGQKLVYTPPAQKSDGPPLTYTVKPLLDGMTIDSASGAWSWTPGNASIGTYHLAIQATVGGKQVPVVTWTITIE